jgi:hypothetical protein
MEKIRYLDGIRFYHAFTAGGLELIQHRRYLNKINVFPVADADTGTNLAATIQAILNQSQQFRSLQATVKSIAESALIGARGNSGIIFAQYLVGLSLELENTSRISVSKFAESAFRAVEHVYNSLSNPVEGTILTVMRAWSSALQKHSSQNPDFCAVLKAAYSEAEKALRNTPEQLEILKKSGVVDAGAQGFVHFLEGILDFIQQGSLRQKREPIPQIEKDVIKNEHALTDAEYRYCTETILSNCSLDVRAFKETFSQFGDSLIVAGSQAKMHIHIHTNEPDIFFYQVKDYATIETIKADDMHSQFEISHKRKYPLGIITDSACDLPREMLEKYQIQQISFGINFGDTIFLDNITINSEQFYKMLETDKHHPVSSQPSPQVVQNMYDLMSQNYEKVYAVHVSKHLSGIFSSAQSLSQEFSNIRVVNSKHLSGTEGLLVLRIAQAIEQGLQENEIDATIDEWIEKSTILTDIDTLKYLVRGGRISPAKGVIAKILNLKPIVSVDKDGKGIAIGKSFNRKQNFTKIMGMLKQIATQNDIWNYSIVHAKNETRAQQYAEKLTQIFGKEPAYIMPISPVIGVHNGIGTVAVCVMSK